MQIQGTVKLLSEALFNVRAWLMVALQVYNTIWAYGRQILGKAKANLAQLVPPNVREGEKLTARGSNMGI